MGVLSQWRRTGMPVLRHWRRTGAGSAPQFASQKTARHFFACGHASLVAQNRHAGSAPPAWEFYRSLARSLLRASSGFATARRISGLMPALFDRAPAIFASQKTARHFFACGHAWRRTVLEPHGVLAQCKSRLHGGELNRSLCCRFNAKKSSQSFLRA